MTSFYWCFTINNPTAELTFDGRVSYAVWQKERGENGTEHLQGYLELVKKGRLSAVKALGGEMIRAHLERRRGTQQQARDYAMKEDTRIDGPWEHGEFVAREQGTRSDLNAAVDALRTGGIKRVAEDHPTAFVKFHRGFRALAEALDTVEPEEGFQPREWQQNVLDVVAGAACDRKIIWVHDSVGGQGKSRLAKHLVRNYGAVLLSGRVADMSYAYNKEKVVLFDVPRTEAENVKHLLGMAEKLKNGMLFSSKYESRAMVFSPPHVIFFANMMPPEGCWSHDRLQLIDLDAGGAVHMGLGGMEVQEAAAHAMAFL